MSLFDEAIRVLRERLVGRAYTCVSLCDSWALEFYDGIWLVAQGLSAPDDEALTSLLASGYLDGVDADEIPVAVSVLRYRRQVVRDLELEPDGSLALMFEGGGKLVCPTNAPIVDWQWVLNTSGKGPYDDYEVACFVQGKVDVAPQKAA